MAHPDLCWSPSRVSPKKTARENECSGVWGAEQARRFRTFLSVLRLQILLQHLSESVHARRSLSVWRWNILTSRGLRWLVTTWRRRTSTWMQTTSLLTFVCNWQLPFAIFFRWTRLNVVDIIFNGGPSRDSVLLPLLLPSFHFRAFSRVSLGLWVSISFAMPWLRVRPGIGRI